jgi:hypothetical protein
MFKDRSESQHIILPKDFNQQMHTEVVRLRTLLEETQKRLEESGTQQHSMEMH